MTLRYAYQEDISAPVPLAVQQLTLCAFRNYADLRLELDQRPVVLTGPNGSGKSNLLEALSLLVPGRGFRRAGIETMQNLRHAEPWGVAVEVQTPQGLIQIGTGRDPSAEDTERRLVKIDGKPVKGQQPLADHIAMAWITPEMDRTLSEGPSARRKLLDRLVYSFDPAHAGRVQRYEKAMRERTYLLRENVRDAAWFAALEDTMAQSGVAIAVARQQMLAQLQREMDANDGLFPQAEMRVEGLTEKLLDEGPALAAEDRLRQALASRRAEDATSGTCGAGPHRSDWKLVHRNKQCPAEYCSTGEQKALLIAVMLAYVRILASTRHRVPLLLLDDIAAHLDEARREALAQELRSLEVQAWLTGTDAAQFLPFMPDAQSFEVLQGVVTPAGM
jgi:DNA replication and repair protein RecF